MNIISNAIEFFHVRKSKLFLRQALSFKCGILSVVVLLYFVVALLCMRDAFSQISCSENTLIGNDLIGIDAITRNNQLLINAYVSKPFGGIVMPGTERQFDFFIDTDQNRDTGDPRPGGLRGIDYRVQCHVLINEVVTCDLYALPVNDIWGADQNLGKVYAILNPPNVLQVVVPIGYNSSDVVAFARGGTDFYGGKTGNGDRCPEYGVIDTATGNLVVRQPAASIDKLIQDSTGADLLGWQFQTFGDQFRLIISYKYAVNPLSIAFSGRIELDTDRDLKTGLVHTPFLIPSPFNEIASWGWDVAIEFMGGGGTASDPTPFSLDFGTQSEYIHPPTLTYASPFFFPFGNGYNDGRWYISGNQVILEGSLSMLDARRWQTPSDNKLNVNRLTIDGKVIGRLFTRSSASVKDMIPKNDKAIDFETSTEVPAIGWRPDVMVSGSSPVDRLAQFDLTQVDAEIDNGNLIVASTLARLESTWDLTDVIFFLETDTDPQTGFPINNEEYNTETILADHILWIRAVKITEHKLPYVGYTTTLYKPDGSKEGHDSGLSIKFSLPWEGASPAKFVMTIPLAVIGNPQRPIRLYAATFNNLKQVIDDVAPNKPLSLGSSITTQTLVITKSGTGSGTVTSNPAGINCGGDCSETYSAGAAVTLTATAAAGSTFAGWSGACSGAGGCTVTMGADRSVTATFDVASTADQTLITQYYQSILGRAPDPGGLAYWQSEMTRLQGLGVDVQEAFRVMAGWFFTSAEYLGRNTGDAQYVTDLYRTFFQRAPDAGGLGFWTGQLAAGMPRAVALYSFLFSAEFGSYMQGLLGNTASRGEVYAVVDFYRGFLNRLPDTAGFQYWLGRFRAAQCQGAAAVNAEVEAISGQFAASGEYANRKRSNRDYVGDLYYAFLRRGGELSGFDFWVNQLDAGARSREQLRREFLKSPEFQSRVQQIVGQGACVKDDPIQPERLPARATAMGR